MTKGADYWGVRWVCTDSDRRTGQPTHPNRELATLAIYEHEGREDVGIVEHSTRRGDATEFGELQDERWTWQLACPTCGRRTEIRRERMVALMQGLRHAEIPFVDISLRDLEPLCCTD